MVDKISFVRSDFTTVSTSNYIALIKLCLQNSNVLLSLYQLGNVDFDENCIKCLQEQETSIEATSNTSRREDVPEEEEQ